jgi:phage shock protein PspC (stress-responsive transcriptional regulator)
VFETTTHTPPRDDAPARRLVRVRDGRWLGGVAAGLGRYFDVNPLVYRIAFAALAFAGGTGILLYLAAWLVIPAEDREESTAVQALREHRDRPWLLLGVGLLLFAAVLVLSEAELWTGLGNVWLAALLAGAALLWWHLAHRDEQPPTRAAAPEAGPSRPRKPSLVAPVLGALLAAAGTLGLLHVLDVYDVDVALALAVAVAGIGLAIAVGAVTGFRVSGLVGVGLVLLAAFGFAAALPVSISEGVGDRLERPVSAAALERRYEYGIGDFELDLRNVELSGGTTRVEASLGIGELLVVVPDDVALDIDAHAGAGEVIVLGSVDDGLGARRELVLPGPEDDSPVLVLDAGVGFGQVEVRRG